MSQSGVESELQSALAVSLIRAARDTLDVFVIHKYGPSKDRGADENLGCLLRHKKSRKHSLPSAPERDDAVILHQNHPGLPLVAMHEGFDLGTDRLG